MPPISAMSSRQRMLATLRQEEVDRFPVWLKTSEEYNRQCGCDLIMYNGVAASSHNPHVRIEVERSATAITTVWHTPGGDLVGVDQIDPG